MKNEVLNKLLTERKKEILKELEAIDILIDATDSNVFYEEFYSKFFQDDYSNHMNVIKSGLCSLSNKINDNMIYYGGGKTIPYVKKDDNSTWKEYLLEVLKELKGNAKTNDIAEVLILSNKDLSFVKARQIAADLLPELVEEGLIEVEKGGSRKEGHTYMLKNNRKFNIDEMIKKIASK